MDAFRTIPMNLIAAMTETRITTSNIYNTKERASKMARMRGLDKLYYNMNVNSKCERDLQANMLLKLRSEHWSKTLMMFDENK